VPAWGFGRVWNESLPVAAGIWNDELDAPA